MSSPTLVGSSLETGRFGAVTLREESFEVAIANDVLEHIPDLAAAMTNVLRLLKPGGVFEILVPYDLSHGAWQDPTHVRAFNERSWIYYTDWHWYLVWVEARFDLVMLQLQMSPLGTELHRAGKSVEEILRTPHATRRRRATCASAQTLSAGVGATRGAAPPGRGARAAVARPALSNGRRSVETVRGWRRSSPSRRRTR